MKTCERTWWRILLLLLFAFPLTGNAVEFDLELVSSWPVGECAAVDNFGDIVYFSSGKFLRRVDFTNPASPVEQGHVAVASPIKEIVVLGRYAYVACGDKGLYIVDFLDINFPVVVGHVQTFDAVDVAVSGIYAYVADRPGGIRAVNVADPANPVIAGNFQTEYDPVSVAVENNYLFIAETKKGIRSINVSDPVNMVESGAYTMNNGATAIRIYNQYAYVLADGLRIFDISSPSYFEQVGSGDITATNKIAVSGSHAFAADLTAGLKIYDVSKVKTPSHIKTYETANSSYDVAINGDRAYLADGDGGLIVLDVSNPPFPNVLGSFNSAGNATSVAVSGNYMYVTDSIAGLRVFNISNPLNPVQIGLLDNTESAVDIEVMFSYAFVSVTVDGNNGGIQVIDISDPANPHQHGQYTLYPSYGLSAANGYVYTAAGDNGMAVVNIANPQYPTLSGGINDILGVTGVSFEREYVMAAAGDNGFYVIDVGTKTTPVERSNLALPGKALNVTSSYPYAYVATENAGLRVLEWISPVKPSELGYYDPQKPVYDVAVNGLFAYLAAENLYIVNVSNPESPYMAGSYEIGGARGIAVDGDYIYVASGENGIYIFKTTAPAPPSDVVLTDVPGDHGHEVEISWTLSPDDGSIVNYHVYRSRYPIPTEGIDINTFETMDALIEAEKTSTILLATLPRGTSYYLDDDVPEANVPYYYWVGAITEVGQSQKVAAECYCPTSVNDQPSELNVSVPYPNPFNPMTTIRYDIPTDMHVRLAVYDILGREVAVLEDTEMTAGVHNTIWNARDNLGMTVGNGVYLYKLIAGDFSHQGKLLFMK